MDLKLVKRIELVRVIRVSALLTNMGGDLSVRAIADFCFSNGDRAPKEIELRLPMDEQGDIEVRDLWILGKEVKRLMITNIKKLSHYEDIYTMSAYHVFKEPHEQAWHRMVISSDFVEIIKKYCVALRTFRVLTDMDEPTI